MTAISSPVKSYPLRFREYLGNGEWHYWGFINDTFVSPIRFYNGKSPKSYQCIDLVDVDNNSIWEGDIVQVWYIDAPGLDQRSFPPYRPQVVKRDEDGTGFTPFIDGCGGCISYEMKAIFDARGFYDKEYGHYIVRIVGNIEQDQ